MQNCFTFRLVSLIFAMPFVVAACGGGSDTEEPDSTQEPDATNAIVPSQQLTGSGQLELANLFDYTSQAVPAYIQKDNTGNNSITNAGATLGRVLFYDTELSSNGSVSCASCHLQSKAFSDPSIISTGVNGATARHSMRLVNARFSDEAQFFWDERAASLEQQTTQPIRDHGELGFSGTDGAPDFDSLLTQLSATTYYPELFVAAFGNSVITENRLQSALAQFVRSIQSFDSRYDEGRAQVNNNGADFPNFSAEENAGKRLFMQNGNFDPATGQRLAGSGLGCNACHRAPEFDIDPNSRSNGVIGVAGNLAASDSTVTRSPTLRDLFTSEGDDNGPFMHDGSLASFDAVLSHYNDITVDQTINGNLDNRLTGAGRPQMGRPPGSGPGQKLLLTDQERRAVTAFIKTLSGENVYTDEKWSNPFDAGGNLELR